MITKNNKKKALVALAILGGNILLFVNYAWKEAQKDSHSVQDSLHDGLEKRDAVLPQVEVHDAVYPITNAVEDGAPPLIIYNRVPKTGSTTFANIAYKLTKPNKFNMLHVNVTYKNQHYLNVIDQQRFVRNISLWTERIPAIYHGHFYYLDFTRFGFPNPIYINIIRDPIERLISYYYFLRYGDDFRPKLKRASAKDTKTLDECLVVKSKDCDLRKVLWIQVPFFCGQSVECLEPNRWALEQAKTNLLNKYLLVGVTEHLEEFVALLEIMLPRYFSGAYDLYRNTELGHLRKTKAKIRPSTAALETIKQSTEYKLEQEFYEFTRDHFEFLIRRTLSKDKHGRTIVNGPNFKFEKIMPAIAP